MNRLDHLLFIAAEEGAEVGQRASKAARFGLEEVQPGQPLSNAQRIMVEWSDACAVIEMLIDEGALEMPANFAEMVAAKKAKVEKFLEYSRSCGRLDGAAPTI